MLPLLLILAAGSMPQAPPAVPTGLALAGAPQSTPVTCTFNTPQQENGWAQWSPTEYILLKPEICTGLEWLQESEPERVVTEQEQPFLNLVGEAGESALVLLHESTHIAGDHDETDTECRALQLLPTYLSMYLEGDRLAQAERTALAYDASLPALYHEHPC